MQLSRDLVILFTRYPRPGKCKTRLISALGREEATRIHRQLVSHCINTLAKFNILENNGTYHIYHAGASEEEMQQWLGKHRFVAQQGRGLGERMANALADNLQTTENCVLIGSDCPDIDPALLQHAFQKLQENDLVLGPAYDGGYYLIGMNHSVGKNTIQKLFTEIQWGTDQVLPATILRAEELSLKYHLLLKLHDIDIHDDLQYFNHRPHSE